MGVKRAPSTTNKNQILNKFITGNQQELPKQAGSSRKGMGSRDMRPHDQIDIRSYAPELPSEIISDIANRLTSFEDIFSFSRVCPFWYSVCTKMRWIPGLISLTGEEQNFSSFDRNRRYELRSIQSPGTRCHGSPHGWIVTMASDNQVHLLNPLSKVQINLPNLGTIRHQIGNIEAAADPYSFIHKCILLKTSEDDNQFLVMVIFGKRHSLAFAKPESDSWTTVRGVSDIKDVVVLFNGQIHAISGKGVLRRFESDDLQSPRTSTVCDPPADVALARIKKIYLLESLGELLAVFRLRSRDAFERRNETTAFWVYKLQPDDSGTQGKWQKLECLGDRVLFVGEGNSWSISTANINNSRSDCICFTDDNWDQGGRNEQRLAGYDIGVFNMNGKIQDLGRKKQSPYYRSRAVYFTPSLSFYRILHA